MQQLRAQSLTKAYKQRTVVEDISLEVNAGEIVGLLGPNGAGKTTSFYMIAGLVKPDKGEVWFNNQTVTNLPMYQRARLGLGYLPQEASIFRHLTVEQNIRAVLQNRPQLTTAEQNEQLEFLLHEFHITSIRKSQGISLSGGERRRVEIARTLAMEPGFILLDEPFAGIDPLSVMDIQKIIQSLTVKNIGILITDHNVRETLSICERGYIVADGKVFAQGTPQQLLENQSVREVYLGENFSL